MHRTENSCRHMRPVIRPTTETVHPGLAWVARKDVVMHYLRDARLQRGRRNDLHRVPLVREAAPEEAIMALEERVVSLHAA